MKKPEKFWEKVDRSGDCWEWLGATNNTGYGTVNWYGVTVTAHRLAAFLSGLVDNPKAPVDRKGGGFVLHKCDNRRCCNPKHFDIGTYEQNQRDAYSRNRKKQPRGESHSNAKLSGSEVAFIRSAYASGLVHQQELADMFGVSQVAISLIIRKKTYA